MDRVAVFVDAGYLLAEGGSVCCGTKRRGEIACDYRGLVPRLVELAGERSGLPVLRLYWYDAARGSAPAKDHLEVARLADVKLRLGRLTERDGRLEQKGVDSLLIRDLMTLSRERAIATALLVGGDEDLREGIAAAQDMGVRVVVVGVAAVDENQAEALVLEADEHLLLDHEFLQPFLKRAPAPELAAGAEATTDERERERAREIGADLARACGENLNREQLSAILGEYPRIPSDLDAQLLKEASQLLGPLRDRFDLKVELRAAFWEELTRVGLAAMTRGPDDEARVR